MDVAHADLAREQQPKDAQSRAIAERFEEHFHLRETLRHIRLAKYITASLQSQYIRFNACEELTQCQRFNKP
jgi:hypothetical protein